MPVFRKKTKVPSTAMDKIATPTLYPRKPPIWNGSLVFVISGQFQAQAREGVMGNYPCSVLSAMNRRG